MMTKRLVVGLAFIVACGGELRMQTADAEDNDALAATVARLESRITQLESKIAQLEARPSGGGGLEYLRREVSAAECASGNGWVAWPELDRSRLLSLAFQQEVQGTGVQKGTVQFNGAGYWCPPADARTVFTAVLSP